MKRLIIFDFYGVISSEVTPQWFRKYFPDRAKELKDYYLIPADLGEYSILDTVDRISNDLGYNKDDIVREWRGFAKLNTELLNTIIKLRKNNTICLLSNAAPGIFDLLFDIDFNKYFDKVFLSCDYHLAKPDLRFYNVCINSFDYEFDEMYFFDDNKNNIDILRDTKIKGIQFTGNEDIIPILDKMI